MQFLGPLSALSFGNSLQLRIKDEQYIHPEFQSNLGG